MSLPGPFRSTANLAARRRQRPVVERATFVIVSLGDWRVAFPVESVERVLRVPRDGDAHAHAQAFAVDGLLFQGRVVPWARFAAGIRHREDAGEHDGADARVLIVHDQVRLDRSWALPVAAVHEVHAVETALVLPPSAATAVDLSTGSAPAPVHAAVRGLFERHGHRVFVVDPVRLLAEAA